VTKCWQTTIYEILYDEPKGFKHLRISRVDGEPIRSWKDIQEIKNDLLGEDVVAIEVFPKQCDFVNGSNTYHIWTWDGIEVPNLEELYTYVHK
jgi:hypothetical protein